MFLRLYTISMIGAKIFHGIPDSQDFLSTYHQCILGYPNPFGPEVVPRCLDK